MIRYNREEYKERKIWNTRKFRDEAAGVGELVEKTKK